MEKQSITSSIAASLDKYFFSKTNGQILGIIRVIIVFSTLYLIYRGHFMMSNIVSINSEFDALHRPSALLQFLSVPFPLPENYNLIFAIIYYFIGLCALIGLFTRPALLIFSLLSIYICDVYVSRGFFNHELSLTTQIILLLALAPGSTSLSVDRFVKWLRQRPSITETKLYSYLVGKPVPVWGLQLIFIVLACTYFTAGLSKVRYGGIKWMDGQTLTHYLDGSASPYTSPAEKPMYIGPPVVPGDKKWKDGFGIYAYSFGNRQSSEFKRNLAMAVASSKTVIMLISASTVIFEICGFILLIAGWPRILYLFGAIAMHSTIGILMNLPFYSYQVLCFVLIDWKWIYYRLGLDSKVKMFLLLFSKRKLDVEI
jgi:hypothetical protein